MSFQSEEDLSCPVCHEVFRDPVVLSCSHSFCRGCLQTWWGGQPVQECPMCRRRSSRSEPPRNLALKNLCESFVLQREQRSRAGSEDLCTLHAERLQLFCLEHQGPACLVCRDSRVHANHHFRPVHELAQEQRRALERALQPLKDQLKVFLYVKGNCEQTEGHIQVQARDTEARIRETFQKLHEFLKEEEEARMEALREEEEQKSQMMKERITAVNRETAALSLTIRETEEQLRDEDVSFLLHYKATVEAVQQRPLVEDPQLPSGALIDVAKHLGNLSFNIWKKMKDQVSYSPVILDPNTAHPDLVLTEDLTGVSHGPRQPVPNNPERTDYHRSVRGSEGLGSGTHSWDVEVGDNPAWFVGVASESVQKARRFKTGFWQIEFFNSKYSARTQGAPSSPLRVQKKLQRIRVHLDLDRGRLVFFDPDGGAHVHTFKHAFTERLFPCMGTLNLIPMKVSGSKICVTRQ